MCGCVDFPSCLATILRRSVVGAAMCSAYLRSRMTMAIMPSGSERSKAHAFDNALGTSGFVLITGSTGSA